MSENLMILPANEHANIRLIKFPDDFEEHEVYRYVTGLIAKVEEDPEYTCHLCYKRPSRLPGFLQKTA